MGKGTSEVGAAAAHHDAERAEYRVELGESASSPTPVEERFNHSLNQLKKFEMPHGRDSARSGVLDLGSQALRFLDVRLRYQTGAMLHFFDGPEFREAKETTHDTAKDLILEGQLDSSFPQPLHAEVVRRDSGFAIREAVLSGIDSLLEQGRPLIDPDIPPMPTELPQIPEPYLDDAVDYTAGTAFVAGGGEIKHSDDGSMTFSQGEHTLLTIGERTPEMLAALRAAAGILAMQLEQTPQASQEA